MKKINKFFGPVLTTLFVILIINEIIFSIFLYLNSKNIGRPDDVVNNCIGNCREVPPAEKNLGTSISENTKLFSSTSQILLVIIFSANIFYFSKGLIYSIFKFKTKPSIKVLLLRGIIGTVLLFLIYFIISIIFATFDNTITATHLPKLS